MKGKKCGDHILALIRGRGGGILLIICHLGEGGEKKKIGGRTAPFVQRGEKGGKSRDGRKPEKEKKRKGGLRAHLRAKENKKKSPFNE